VILILLLFTFLLFKYLKCNKTCIKTDINNFTKILTYDKDTHFNTCDRCINDIKCKGWKPIFIDETANFFTRINQNNNQKISELVIVVHSIPGKFGNYFDLTDISEFAKKLEPFIDSNTIIYLNGCNTGIKSYAYNNCLGISNAQRLSNLTKCKVLGSRGFLHGSFAEGNEHCYQCDGSYCVGFTDSFSNVWTTCLPSTDNCSFQYAVQASSTLYVRLLSMKENNRENLITSFEHPVRPFPDFQLRLKLNKLKYTYDVYLIEGLVYDNSNKQLYSYSKDELKVFVDSLSFFTKELQY